MLFIPHENKPAMIAKVATVLGENGINVSSMSVFQEHKTNKNKPYRGSTKQSVPAVYNSIILDESGSMSGVTGQTITGCNETLNGIRTTAIEEIEQNQFVSIYCFDTTNSRYLFKNRPIEVVNNGLILSELIVAVNNLEKEYTKQDFAECEIEEVKEIWESDA